MKIFNRLIVYIIIMTLVGGLNGFAQENIAPRTITIIIQEGDTLWKIASSFLNDPFLWQELLKYNEIEDPNLIYAGNTLQIPISDQSAAERALQQWEKYLEEQGKSESEIDQTLSAARNAFEAGDFGLAHGLASKEIEDISGIEATQGRSVKVILIKGKVMVRRFGELDWKSADINMKLESGDAIRTHSDSYAQVLFDNTNKLDVKSNALIVIGDLTEDKATNVKRSTVKLLNSDVRATVRKGRTQLQIETPSATAEIQDANLAVRVGESGNSEFRVFTGSAQIKAGTENVNLTNNKALRVNEEEGVTIEELPPSPQLASPEHQKVFNFRNIMSRQIKLAWRSVSKANAYHIEIARYRSFNDMVEEVRNWGSTDYTFKNFSEGIYYWRISGIDAKGLESEPSEYRIFMVTTSAMPEAEDGKEPPFLAVTDPQLRKGELYMDTILISGETEPGATVYINNSEVSVDRRGAFSLELKNQLEGRRVITVKAVGENGGIAFVQKDVFVEK
jgi:hypothetical protein